MSILNDLDFCGGALFPINPDATAKLLDVRAKVLRMEQAVDGMLRVSRIMHNAEDQQELVCMRPATHAELKNTWLEWQK